MTSPSPAAPPPDVKLARRVVLGVHRRMMAALNAATDAALEEWLSGVSAESAPPPPPAVVCECAGCNPSGALCPGHPVAPPPPPVEGPGLAEAVQRLCVAVRALDEEVGGDRAEYPPVDAHLDELRAAEEAATAALAAEEAREKLRREAARLFRRDDIPDNRLTYSPDDSPAHMHLEIDEDTVATIRALFAAELGSAP